MRTAMLVCGCLAALLAGPAAAQGVNLNWSNCYGNGPVARNRNFACDTNAGFNQMVASYVTPAAGVRQLAGIEMVFDLASESTVLPAWWQFFNTGECRQTALAEAAPGARRRSASSSTRSSS